jgi:hypothetical protein
MTRLSQHGSFDESLENGIREELLAEFAENDDTLNFARCQRQDGSFYGIPEGLQCRKGTKAAPAEKYKPKRKKRTAPSDTAQRMAAAYDRLMQEKAKRDSEREPAKAIKQDKRAPKKKKKEAIKPVEKTKSQKPKSEKASGEKIKPETKKRLSELSPEKLEKLSKMQLTSAQKAAVEEAKSVKQAKAPVVEKKATEQPDAEVKKKDALQLINSTETRLKSALKAAREEFEKTGSDEADDRMYTIRDQLQRIADDRKAIENGIFSKPAPKPLTEAQRTRIDAQIETLRAKATGRADKNNERYRRLMNMRDAKDPKEMAAALRDKRQADKEYEIAQKNDFKLIEKGASRAEREAIMKPIRDKRAEADRRIEYAKIDSNERFGRYVMSQGMIKLLDSDANPSQNAAHKNSNAIFAEHGELGNSKQAQALVKKFGGDREEVQRGIDAIIDFTRNDYRAIRRAVEQPGSDDYRAAQAKRIDTMLGRMDHPTVTKFRGISLPKTALDGLVSASKSNSTFSDPAPSSWSTSALISSGYAGQSKGGRVAVMFETNNKTGASVENFGQSGEKEILTPGNTSYRHTGYRVETHEGLPIHIFTVEEL